MHAVVTVIGKDKTGIIAKVSAFLADRNVNIMDISQTIMEDYFAMIMLVDIEKASCDLATLSLDCTELGKSIGMSIHVQHESIFNVMHNV